MELLSLLMALAPAVGAGAPPQPEAVETVVVAEAFVTAFEPNEDVDSVAVWHGSVGRHWILATAKATHRLLVFDASTGKPLRRYGQAGEEPGSFRRPNGITVVGELAFVVERDNRRVQVLRLPGLETVATFGNDVLRRPYGITAYLDDERQHYEIYITDNYMTQADTPPPSAFLSGRLRHFRASSQETPPRFEHIADLGATSGVGVLLKVETIASDPERNRLFVADENESQNYFKAFDGSGRFVPGGMGRGVVQEEPEGLALYSCGSGGYWLASDQHEARTRFLVFERESLAHVGSFTGMETANTDGVAVTATPFGPFQRGAFFAVHNDGAVAAFSMEAILDALALACP